MHGAEETVNQGMKARGPGMSGERGAAWGDGARHRKAGAGRRWVARGPPAGPRTLSGRGAEGCPTRAPPASAASPTPAGPAEEADACRSLFPAVTGVIAPHGV